MKILIKESQYLNNDELLKKVCFSYWNKIGYATSHPSFLKIFKIPSELIINVQRFVDEWNKEHEITPLSILEKDFGKFHQSSLSPHLYMWPDRRGGSVDIEVSDGRISAVVRIHSMYYNENDGTLDVYCEVPTQTIKDVGWGGKTFEEVYPYGYETDDEESLLDYIDEDEYWDTYDEYRGEINWVVNKYMYKKYVSKMGKVELEIENY